MISTAPTADTIETQAVEVRVVAARFRRAIQDASHVRLVYHGRLVARQLEAFVNQLRAANNDAVFDSMPDTDFSGLLDDMVKLYALLSEVLISIQRAGLDKKPVHRNYCSRIQVQTEQLGDVIETFRLGLDPKFGAMVEEAVGRLRVGR